MNLGAWIARYRQAMRNPWTRWPVLLLTGLWLGCWVLFAWLLWTNRH